MTSSHSSSHGTALCARARASSDRECDDDDAFVAPSLYLSTTYARDVEHALPRVRGFARCYARDDDPTQDLPQRAIATLERGAACALFASGMAAMSATIEASVEANDRVLWPRRGYFATRARAEALCARLGGEFILYDGDSPKEEFEDTQITTRNECALERMEIATSETLEAALRSSEGRTIGLVWIESPANPTWDVMDVSRAVEAAKARGVRCVCVDSTVFTPICSKPLTFGADLVMHSASKYLNGHSDVLAGALVTNDEKSELWRKIKNERKLGGAVLGAFEAYLLMRGLRTLELRVRHQSDSASWLARELQVAMSDCCIVLYPGLQSHPQYETAKKMCPDGYFGGMLSIVITNVSNRVDHGGIPDIERLIQSPKYIAEFCRHMATRSAPWTCATSLGGFESLIEHRYSVEYSKPRFDAKTGHLEPHVPVGLLRLSVGLEDKRDLLEGLVAGFQSAIQRVHVDMSAYS